MSKLGVVIVFTKRFDELASFYRDVLRLPVKDSDPGEGYNQGVDCLAYETGEAMLELFDQNVHGVQLGDANTGEGYVVTGIGVSNLDEWVASLPSGTRTLGSVREADWGRYIYLVDSDSNIYQVYEERVS